MPKLFRFKNLRRADKKLLPYWYHRVINDVNRFGDEANPDENNN